MIILGVRNFRVFEILEHLPYSRYRKGFSYRSEVGTRGLLILGEKSIWPIKIGKIDTGPPF